MAIYDPKQIEDIVKYRVQQEMQKFIDRLHKCMETGSLNECTNCIFGIINEMENLPPLHEG